MKYLILAIGIILSNFAAKASSSIPDVSCGEFKFMFSLRINLDLKLMTYEVFETLTANGQDKFIRSGEISSNLFQDGPYVIYQLIEGGKVVGFLKAISQNVQPRQSFLTFTEQGWSYKLLCVIETSN